MIIYYLQIHILIHTHTHTRIHILIHTHGISRLSCSIKSRRFLCYDNDFIFIFIYFCKWIPVWIETNLLLCILFLFWSYFDMFCIYCLLYSYLSIYIYIYIYMISIYVLSICLCLCLCLCFYLSFSRSQTHAHTYTYVDVCVSSLITIMHVYFMTTYSL